MYENLAGDLERIALFGSRTRDDWRPDSDYDLLLMKGRESSDYDLFSPIEKQDAEEALGEVEQFVEQARRYVESQGITLES